MAIIKCPECGQEISDKAELCVHCGYPLKNHNDNNNYQKLVKEREDKLFQNLKNTECVLNGIPVDFSEAVSMMKQWNKECIQKILYIIFDSQIDISIDSQMVLLQTIMLNYEIPKEYNGKTEQEYRDRLEELKGRAAECFLHGQKYNFNDEVIRLQEKGKLSRKGINNIKNLSILTEPEKRMFLQYIEENKEFPLSFPEDFDTTIYHNGIKEAEKFFNQHYKKVHKKKKKKNKQHSSNKPKQIIQQSNVPHCPTCGSTNIEKISMTRKAVGFLAVGFLSSSARNTYRCKNCGYKW